MVVHVAGLMHDIAAISAFAAKHGLWVVEDAAHAFPAAWRSGPNAAWQRCGEGTAAITCYSFYSNKTITTGEGGMAVTNRDDLAERMRLMSLHGLSRDAWDRYRGGSWDYKIVETGFKYNLTDIASAIGRVQLQRAEELRRERERQANVYLKALSDIPQIELPPTSGDRIHSWHLFFLRLRLDRLTIDRNRFITELNERGVGTSVHWRPLHLHQFYEQNLGWPASLFPVMNYEWTRRVTIPMFPGMTDAEQAYVIDAVKDVCQKHQRTSSRPSGSWPTLPVSGLVRVQH
jgi:perosamine synthetase